VQYRFAEAAPASGGAILPGLAAENVEIVREMWEQALEAAGRRE
jgi:hypothetical protein